MSAKRVSGVRPFSDPEARGKSVQGEDDSKKGRKGKIVGGEREQVSIRGGGNFICRPREFNYRVAESWGVKK